MDRVPQPVMWVKVDTASRGRRSVCALGHWSSCASVCVTVKSWREWLVRSSSPNLSPQATP